MQTDSPADRDPADESATEAEAAALARAKRRRTLDQIFGEVLPDATRDDRNPDSGSGNRAREDEIKRDVPPHHSG
jgi:hypothetical protein